MNARRLSVVQGTVPVTLLVTLPVTLVAAIIVRNSGPTGPDPADARALFEARGREVADAWQSMRSEHQHGGFVPLQDLTMHPVGIPELLYDDVYGGSYRLRTELPKLPAAPGQVRFADASLRVLLWCVRLTMRNVYFPALPDDVPALLRFRLACSRSIRRFRFTPANASIQVSPQRQKPECGDVITKSVMLTRDLMCTATTGLTIADDDVVLDLGGHTLSTTDPGQVRSALVVARRRTLNRN